MLDFGAAFDGGDRFLEISVRPDGAAEFTSLAPRQPITSTPYAIRAREASTLPAASITTKMLAPGAVTQLGTPDGSNLAALTVDETGSIGIGTTEPQAGLHIGTGKQIPRLVMGLPPLHVFGFAPLMGAEKLVIHGDLAVVSTRNPGGIRFFNLRFGSNLPRPPQLAGDDGFALRDIQGLDLDDRLLAVASREENTVTLFDLSDVEAPSFASALVNDIGGFDALAGASDVVITGNLLIIASAYDSAVTLADITDPGNAFPISVLRDDNLGFDDLRGANHLAVSGNLLAIAARNDEAVTLVEISNPSSPTLLSTVKQGMDGAVFLRNISDLELAGNVLAIASEWDNAVTFVDVSIPSAPVVSSSVKDGENGINHILDPSSVAMELPMVAITSPWDNAVTVLDISITDSPKPQTVAVNNIGGIVNLDGASSIAFHNDQLIVAADRSGRVSSLILESGKPRS